MDGDGHADLLISAAGGPDGSAAYLIFGATSPVSMHLSDADSTYSDASDRMLSGAGAGDVNADGLDDLVIGTPGLDYGTADMVDVPSLAFLILG